MKLFIDAGHGGADSGAVGNSSKEKDITLAVAKRVEYHIKRNGHQTLMSRTTDINPSLGVRTWQANSNNCDALVSIHINDSDNITATGIETFCYKLKYRKLADCVHSELLATKCYTTDRGVKEKDLHMVRESTMDACLVELGFIKNQKDYTYLCNNQEAFAIAITKCVLKYFGLKYKEEDKTCPTCNQVIK